MFLSYTLFYVYGVGLETYKFSVFNYKADFSVFGSSFLHFSQCSVGYLLLCTVPVIVLHSSIISVVCEWLTDTTGRCSDVGSNESIESAAMTPGRDGSEMPTSIAVIGLPMSVQNTERLRNYFSVSGRSGGDVIQNSDWDLQHHAFIITYGSSERQYFHGLRI